MSSHLIQVGIFMKLQYFYCFFFVCVHCPNICFVIFSYVASADNNERKLAKMLDLNHALGHNNCWLNKSFGGQEHNKSVSMIELM